MCLIIEFLFIFCFYNKTNINFQLKIFSANIFFFGGKNFIKRKKNKNEICKTGHSNYKKNKQLLL